jgi:hypothetical protein
LAALPADSAERTTVQQQLDQAIQVTFSIIFPYECKLFISSSNEILSPQRLNRLLEAHSKLMVVLNK